MSVLGWILFAVTIVVAVWRDIHKQAEAEEAYQEDLEYWEAKREEWLAEKRNLEQRMLKLVSRLRDVERAMRDV